MTVSNRRITLGELETIVDCKQFIAARATSVLPLRMLFLTRTRRESHPETIQHIYISFRVTKT